MNSQRMAQIDWSGVDKIIYINLKKRPDRDAHMRQELARLRVPPEKIIRFDAVESDPGYMGCTQSHLAVLKLAQQRAWETILVLEDDIVFMHDRENIGRVNHFLHQLTTLPWDVAFLAANYLKVEPVKTRPSFLFEYQSTLVKTLAAYCSCAYLVNNGYYQKLIDNLAAGVQLMEATGEERHTIDANWLKIMPKDNWFGIYPNSGYQMESKSDIRNHHVNYKRHFFKPLADII